VISYHIGGVVASYVHLEGGRLWALAPVGSNQTIKLVFVASLLSTQHQGERAQNQDNMFKWDNMSTSAS
jgi:hypothetical protein